LLNSVSLTGRLTRDVDLRYTQSGTAAGSFTLAVDRKFKSKNGERETDFVNCQIWRKSAENFANFTKKDPWLVWKAVFKRVRTITRKGRNIRDRGNR